MKSVRRTGLGEKVRQYYEDPSVVAGYSKVVSGTLTPFEAALTSRFSRGQVVLDVGCGAGREAVAMAAQGLRVVAIDVSVGMVKAALSARSPKYPFHAIVANASRLPFREKSFEGVTLLGQVIAHLPSRSLRIAVLQEVWRALRPGGRLVMTTHNYRCHPKFIWFFFVVNRWRRLKRWCGLPTALGDFDRMTKRDLVGPSPTGERLFFHMYDWDEAVADLKEAGFAVLEGRGRREYESGQRGTSGPSKDYLLGFVAERPL